MSLTSSETTKDYNSFMMLKFSLCFDSRLTVLSLFHPFYSVSESSELEGVQNSCVCAIQ